MDTNFDIKDLVGNNNKAIFTHYESGCLYYEVDSEKYKYIFPVDVTNKEDIGLAQFKATEKAIHLMRYVRKAAENHSLIIITK
jgi:hypothetical protein